jgi:hypothetical protein
VAIVIAETECGRFSPWPDDAPPIGSAFARDVQDLRIFVQIFAQTRPAEGIRDRLTT